MSPELKPALIKLTLSMKRLVANNSLVRRAYPGMPSESNMSECLVQECTRVSLVAFGAAGEQHPGIPVTGDRLRNAVRCSVGLP